MKINQEITRQVAARLYESRVGEIREYFGDAVALKFYTEVETRTKNVNNYAEVVVIIGEVFFQFINEEFSND
jgi:phosphate uptake regulator